MVINRIADLILYAPYPVDLNKLIGDVQSLMREHAACDIYLPEATIRKAILTSLDLIEGNEYDIDTELEELGDDTGVFEFDRAEAISWRDEGS